MVPGSPKTGLSEPLTRREPLVGSGLGVRGSIISGCVGCALVAPCSPQFEQGSMSARGHLSWDIKGLQVVESVSRWHSGSQ